MSSKKSTLLFFFFFFLFSNGQEHILVHYKMSYKKDSTENIRTEKDFVLYSSPVSKSSFYCSYDKFKYDSAALARQKNNLSPTMNFDFQFMTEKSSTLDTFIRYEKRLNNLFAIKISPNFKWKITAEKKDIDIYTAQKAVLNYKGRIWEAWFTTEIPISDGPYIFNGLPGLILEMRDTQENFLFVGTMIRKQELNISPIMSLKPLFINQPQFNKVQLDYYKDPYREMKSGNIKVNWLDENGKAFSPNYNELTLKEQEALRKYNNPIELSDAIIYN